MSPLKRKRPHDAAPESPPSAGEQSTAAGTRRRATRHTTQASTIAPLPWQADPEPHRRRRRRRADTAGPDGRPSKQPRDRRPVLRATTNQADRAPGLKAARGPRHRNDDDDHDPGEYHGSANGPTKPMHVGAIANLRHRGPTPVGPVVGSSQRPPSRHPQAQAQAQPPTPSKPSPTAAAPMTQLPSRSVRVLDHVAANTSKPFAPPTTTTSTTSAQPPPRPVKKQQQLAKDHRKPNTATRNIDKVVFGNVCFSTWYHSPYGTEALGEISGSNTNKANNGNGSSSHDGSIKEEGLSSNNTPRRSKEDRLDRLYVCPCCFKYSKELVPWWQHVHLCERRNHVPGEKIYTHPKGRRTHQVPAGTAAAPTAAAATAGLSKGHGRKKRGGPEPAAQTVEKTVEDQGEWSIWQVDGEKEGLFCQNLSLFAKLFLDNKSVFFDVVCFNYFLLVHTSPRPPPVEGGGGAGAGAGAGGSGDGGDNNNPNSPHNPPAEEDTPPPRRQIVGFFSKEKLSWDNNNLACILIFPPWQRKGLGALLMGVSYEISRREGMIGGPEKPISDLGKKGYKRFWAGEIAAWILGLDTGGGDDEGGVGEKKEVVIDVEECSRATWIVQEDCLAVLREMAVVEEAGIGPPKPRRRREAVPEAVDEEEGGDGSSGEIAAAAATAATTVPIDVADGDQDKEKKEVRRVQMTKAAVWNWVKTNGISLEKACDPSGFVEGYAIKKAAVEEEDI